MPEVRIAAIGDNVVDCYPALGTMFPGGNTVNVAVFSARFGAESSYLGQVAPDAAGAAIERALREEGVDTSGLRRAPGKTAFCLIGHHDVGDRVFLSSDLGVSRFQPTAEDLRRIGNTDAVHVGASGGLDQWIPDFAGRTRVSYDFSVSASPERVRLLGSSCYLASYSGGGLDDREFEDLLALSESSGSRWSLVTRGTRGAVLSSGLRRWTVPAHPMGRAVDTLGAGDTFCARVLVGLLQQEDPVHVLRDAAAAAAQTCTAFGAFGHGEPLATDIGALTRYHPSALPGSRPSPPSNQGAPL